jgi:hypothetical protein
MDPLEGPNGNAGNATPTAIPEWPPTGPATTQTAAVPVPGGKTTQVPRHRLHEIRVIMHAPVLYFWPVWAVGFLMALLTWADNSHMVVVPEKMVDLGRNVVVVPADTTLEEPIVHMHHSRVCGVVFAVTLLVSIYSVGGPLRGPWQYVVGATLASTALLLLWVGLWQPILAFLDTWVFIYINLAGYLVISVGVFLYWALFFFILDRRTFVVISMSQIRVRDHVGESERVYDAGGLYFEKLPYDYIRFLIGLGAADLHLRTSGAVHERITLRNATWFGRRRLVRIEELLQTREVD